MAEQKHFAVCIRNEEYEASLELRKIYEVLEDTEAAKHQTVRVVDEEGDLSFVLVRAHRIAPKCRADDS
ncbi:MAG TPA: hypothetical protein VGK31_10900 [Thermoanaerobaculia bacterium]